MKLHHKKHNRQTKKHKTQKYDVSICDNKMTFEECELAVLRHAVDENEKQIGQQIVNTDAIQQIIEILENFLIKKKLICYGGTAINNILPKEAQFYNKEMEIPDYDFFTPNALNDAKELADIYYEKGFTEVEAKAGMHIGTYKVYVNFMPIADITYINKSLFKKLMQEAITISGIKYTPPNFLRMSMYLELSRPRGDVTRWEKVFKRLNILNKYFPMKDVNCVAKNEIVENKKNIDIKNEIRNSFIEQNAVFIGGFAYDLFSKQNNDAVRCKNNSTNYDVIHENPEKCVMILTERLKEHGIQNVKIVIKPAFGEIVPERIDILVKDKTMASVYKTIGCHNYNTIVVNGKDVNVATIDTIMSFYLAFIYADGYEEQRERIMCMSKHLFDIQKNNRLNQHGLLKRFSMKCLGKQPTIEIIRHEKNELFKVLQTKKNTVEYETYFLNYRPEQRQNKRRRTVKRKQKWILEKVFE